MNNFMFKTLIERKLIDLNSEAGKAYQKIKASLEVVKIPTDCANFIQEQFNNGIIMVEV